MTSADRMRRMRERRKANGLKPEIAAIITELSEEGARLRQSTPFAGVLSVEERRRIYEAFRT